MTQKPRPFFSFFGSVFSSIKKAVSENPDVKRIVEHHPRFFNFLKNRLKRRQFTGLPLTLIAIVFAYALVQFFGIVQDIIASDPIVNVDTRVNNLLFSLRAPSSIRFFLSITYLGKWDLFLLLLVVASLLFLVWRRKSYIIPMWLTVGLTELFVFFGKVFIHRPRPNGIIPVYIEDSFSFPSGHAAGAIAFYGFLAYAFGRNTKNEKYRWTVIICSAIVIFLIGFSRIFLGVHYLSDVLGGYLIGFLILIAVTATREWLMYKHGVPMPSKSPRLRLKVFSACIIAAVAVFYVVTVRQFVPTLNSYESSFSNEVTIANALEPFTDGKLPKYTETITGRSQEPLGMLILAKSDDDLVRSFRASGWLLADRINFASLIEIAKASMLNRPYPQAPMTPSFWNKNVNDFGFQRPTETNTARERHHARFWKTNLRSADGYNIYVGTASLDIGIKWVVTHRIRPDIDTERDVLLQDLRHANVVTSVNVQKFVNPVLGKNFSGDSFFTDGEIDIIHLR